MAWSFLKPNEAARDYKIRVAITALASHRFGATTISNAGIVLASVTYGNEYVYGAHGWSMALKPTDNYGEDLVVLMDFFYPQFGVVISNYPLTWGPHEIYVNWRDVINNVTNCYNWEVDFGSMSLFVDDIEYLIGGNSIIPAGPSYAESGSNWQLRNLAPSWQGSTPTVFIRPFGHTPCAPYVPSYDRGLAFYWAGGWAHDGGGWVHEPTLMDATSPPPKPGCPCVEAIPYLVANHCDDYRGEVYENDNLTFIGDVGPITCIDTGTGLPVVFDHMYLVERSFDHRTSGVVSASRTHGILTRELLEKAACKAGFIINEGDYTIDITPLTDPTYTYSLPQMESLRFHELTSCGYDVSGVVGELNCPILLYELCLYRGLVQASWPTEPPCGGEASYNPFLYQDDLHPGRLHITDVVGVAGTVRYRRAAFSTPAQGFVFETISNVTSTAGWSDPRCALTYQGLNASIILVATRTVLGVSNVYRFHSEDDGKTWSTGELVMPLERHGTVATGEDGSEFIAAFQETHAGPTYGILWGIFREAGDVNYSVPFVFRDHNLNPIVVEDDTFHHMMAHDSSGRWVGTWKIYGETDTSVWWSTDNGRTWTRSI